MMAADVINIGAVYVEEDLGSDLHGDLFYVTFNGGADNTQLSKLTFNGDLNQPGFGVGDLFFDTQDGGYGADHSFGFQIEKLQTANSNASVKATVQDGTSLLVLEFTNFVAGDLLVFSIDVDEVQYFDPAETDLSITNENFDPITSGVEFQNTLFQAEFSAPHYEFVEGQSKFRNRYDADFAGTNLSLPADDEGGKRDRTAGTALQLQQVPKPISLGGIVYQDRNEDLTLQSTDTRIAGVNLELFRLENGKYVTTGYQTTTDSQGRYEFGTQLGLQPGTYQVRETQPANYYSVGATPGKLDGATVGNTVANDPDVLTEVKILLGDQHVKDLNFAENLPSTLSGKVCVVTSGDDCHDANATKAPLAGVLIELRDASGTVIATQRTDANGRYEFIGLHSGVYSITEYTPTGLLDGDALAGSLGGIVNGGGLITQIVLTGDTRGVNYDFCELTPAELSGHTFYDQNNNGRRDSGESPLSNVVVVLWDADGAKVAETRTDAQGYYKFTGLPPGVYRVTEQTPADYIPGKADVGTVGGQRVGVSDSTGDVIASIKLGAGGVGLNYDFGEILPGSIAGRVISDTNGNCIIDAAGEMPLSGVRIELLDQSGTVLQTTLTDAEGRYTFDDLLPGNYSIREIQPAGYFNGDHHAGSGGGDDSIEDLVTSIIIQPGQDVVDYDFCELPPGSIAGNVYVDSDQDCILDAGEKMLSGVTITLLNANGQVVATTQTDANGAYLFQGLEPGVYTVRESQPAGYLQGSQKAGSGGGNDSQQDVVSAIALNPGAALVNYDFCEIEPATIAGTVFVDSDDDCYFDSNEEPLAGVTVELLDANGNVLMSTVTDAQGNYQFAGLAPGRYAVRESQPTGYFQGGQKAGSGGGNDSVEDVISAIDISPGADLIDYDFCEVLPGSISGSVFVDLDFDCEQDPNESSLQSVQVDLLDAQGNVLATTTTAADGTYTFAGLRPGTYSVREHQPIGLFHGGQVAPTTGGDASVADLISGIQLSGGQHITDANFCEVPPVEISGYVFQDGPDITNATGTVPDDRYSVRDGKRTSDDTPLAGVTLQLRLVTGAQAGASSALPGYYSGDVIEVTTDANGYYSFPGLRAGAYIVFEIQPKDYVDSLDRPGTLGGVTLNSQSEVDAFFNAFPSSTLRQFSAGQMMDAVVGINLNPGESSQENNFSEVRAKSVLPPPPLPPTPPDVEKVVIVPPLYIPPQPILATPPTWSPLPLEIGFGHSSPPTWHLSVINAGYPRGLRNGEPVSETTVAENAEKLDLKSWTVDGMKRTNESWRSISTNAESRIQNNDVFHMEEGQPLAGDFNGDGVDEIALFADGEWFIDLNGNGVWDEDDIWLRMGNKGDQPVVGDWDGDGKSDVGIFGEQWDGDQRAIAAEPGLPDPDNLTRARFKNVPPSSEEAPDTPRLLKRSRDGEARADLIDHVFRFGSGKDIAVSGDFNGDGIATIGVFRDGQWRLDVNGDGKLTSDDEQHEFGAEGDLPLVGDFDGDGIEELAIVRGNQVFVDSNGNGQIDATDQVFEIDSSTGTVLVGDFDGDGLDEPIVHQSSSQQRVLQARRAM
ncbi:SdrD B-like domain-containing protein [Aureliella helgolandensis]|nr:SdrD B-like domain-containing protein [Aureliella helgolandensis]